MKTVVVVGNPKPKSRTLAAATLVAQKLTGSAPDEAFDLIEFGAALFDGDDPAVAAAIRTLQEADIAIVASPTYKASYTGVLKLFLDRVPADGLSKVTAFAVMLGAGPAHALAPELSLKPVLVELGANCPASGLYLSDKTFAEDPRLDAWVGRARRALSTNIRL